MIKSKTSIKENFKDGYYEVINYLQDCHDSDLDSFNGVDFAVHIAEQGKLDVESIDRESAYRALDEGVDEVLEFNDFDEYGAYLYGINIAFGALNFGQMVMGLNKKDDTIEFLKERFDHDWEGSRKAIESEGIILE